MNVHARPLRQTTQAAEGLHRWPWTVAEIERLVEAGIVAENERFELIGGEIVPMNPKGAFHEGVKKELNRHWAKLLPPDLDMITETTFRLGAHDFLEPDFVFWPRALGITGLKPDVVQLVVEIADSSLAYDLGRKAALYAALGIADYWVINAQTLVTHIHREPSPNGFAQISDHAGDAVLTPKLLPGLAVRLTALSLSPSAA